jgi:SPP1 family predicted phage head-tail adaptor
MRSGTLDRRVQFRRATLSDDGLGMAETWANHGAPVWASKEDVSDAERWRASEVSAHITTRFQVRYSPFTADLTPKDRLRCERREYEITGIKEAKGRRQALEITAAVRTDIGLIPFSEFSAEFSAEFA